jgi:hypothetical protein
MKKNNTYKLFLMFLGWVFTVAPVYAKGTKDISIEYKHSRRVPYNNMTIEIRCTDDGYQIHVKTTQMADGQGFEYSNTDRIIPIDEEYYNMIYEKIVNVKFSEVILANRDVFGADGVEIRIKIGTPASNLVLTIWSPWNDMLKRRTEEINIILQDLFAKVELREWY